MANGSDILVSSADTYVRPNRVDIRDRAISVQTDQRQSLLLRQGEGIPAFGGVGQTEH